jgi:hypothetical protein
MWNDLREVLVRLWHWSQKSAAERRAAKVRARFWADVRAGSARRKLIRAPDE